MLVLSRKLEEDIYVGDIMIKIIDINKNTVKIGIEAPKNMPILRGELKKAIEETNKEANHKATLDEVNNLSRLLKK